jgi:hypothetical protein
MRFPRFLLSPLLLLSFAPRSASAQPASFEPRGPGGGGALFAPSFNPADPNELTIACDMSELFRSTDFGASWTTVSAEEIQGGRSTRSAWTSSPLVRFAIDATDPGGAGGTRPSKSTDGGVTWSWLTNDPTGAEAYSLWADPSATGRLLLSSWSELFFSSDGGTTWGSKFANDPGGNGCHVAGVFWDGSNIYVGTNAGLLVSTNGGSSFVLSSVAGIPSGEAIASFAGAKQGTVTRLFAVTLAAGSVYAGYFVEGAYWDYLGVYTLDVGASSWTSRTGAIPAGELPALVATSPGNISIAWIAGQQDSTESPILYRTTDGGATWSSRLTVANNANVATGWAGWQGDRFWSYGAGALGLAVAPSDPGRVAFTDLGFVHKTSDGGATWAQGYVDPLDQNPAGLATPKGKAYRSNGLENTSCWGITWADSTRLFGSWSDIRGTRSTDGGLSWGFGYSGHTLNTMYRAIRHPSTGVLYAATSTAHDLYQSTFLTDARIDGANGQVLRSTDLGATWSVIYAAGHAACWVEADPNNSNRLYASVAHSSAGGIYVTNNLSSATPSWTRLTSPPRTQGHPFNVRVLADGTLVSTWSGRISGSFTASSGVFVSTDSGTTWFDRSHSGMQYWTKDLVVDPGDPTESTWYVGVWSGWGGAPNGLGGLYRTANRGVSWNRINALDRVSSIAIHPSNRNVAYLTTEMDGLWYTSNLTATTPAFTRVSSYPFRQPERVFFDPYDSTRVWVTSFGNGIRVGTAILDSDGDGIADPADCAPNNGAAWAIPGPARQLLLSDPGSSGLAISWSPPSSPGGSALLYDLLRGGSPSDFSAALCVASDTSSTSSSDTPPAGGLFCYLVRSQHVCGGTLGSSSAGTPRSGRGCP